MMPSPLRHTIQVFPNGAQPQIDPSNRAFRYGDGLFETILLHQGRPLNWHAHMARLLQGAATLGYDHDAAAWQKAFEAAVHTFDPDLSEPWARLRLQVWRQSEGAYSPATDEVAAQADWQPLPGDPWQAAAPQRLLLCHDMPLVESRLSALKSCSALPYVYAARLAQRAGYDDALLRNAVDGGIAEASAANVFLVRGANLLTPPLKSGCLPGTVRAEVMAAAPSAGLELREVRIDPLELQHADEIFLTNAIRGLVPVVRIDGSPFAPKGSATTDHLRQLLRVRRGMPG